MGLIYFNTAIQNQYFRFHFDFKWLETKDFVRNCVKSQPNKSLTYNFDTNNIEMQMNSFGRGILLANWAHKNDAEMVSWEPWFRLKNFYKNFSGDQAS